MDRVKYNNADWTKLARDYGVIEVTMGADGSAQANDGVSIPCRGCYIEPRERTTDPVKFAVGTPATAVFGVTLGAGDTGEVDKFQNDIPEGAPYLWVPVSDVSEMYFYGTWGHTVDVMYFYG